MKVNLKNDKELKAAVYRAAEISKILTMKLTDEEIDLFEEYGNLLEEITKYK